MSELHLRLLGAPEATLDALPVKRFGSIKALALLVYLVVECDRSHRRASLAALLWPDESDRTARSNLRHALFDLRQAIGDRAGHGADACDSESPILLVTRESIQFNCDSACWVDVHVFRSLIEQQPLGLPDAGQLAEAVTLYRGPFLDWS